MKTETLLHSLTSKVLQITDAVNHFSSLPLTILNKKPGADGWSILECFAHLNLYNRYYINALEEAISKSNQAFNSEEVNYTWIGNYSIKMMEPSNLKKQKTFKKMIPKNSGLNETVLKEFAEGQSRLLIVLEKAQVININSKVIKVEFLRLLKMTIAETLQFVVVHEQRHLLQAEKLKARFSNTHSPTLIM